MPKKPFYFSFQSKYSVKFSLTEIFYKPKELLNNSDNRSAKAKCPKSHSIFQTYIVPNSYVLLLFHHLHPPKLVCIEVSLLLLFSAFHYVYFSTILFRPSSLVDNTWSVLHSKHFGCFHSSKMYYQLNWWDIFA